jgi:hypothetical protein
MAEWLNTRIGWVAALLAGALVFAVFLRIATRLDD